MKIDAADAAYVAYFARRQPAESPHPARGDKEQQLMKETTEAWDAMQRSHAELLREVERLRERLADVEEVATLTIVMLAGLEDMWAELALEERAARAEGELRGLLDRLFKDRREA